MKILIYGCWEKNCFKYNPKVGTINIEEVDEVKLLRITIDKDLNLRNHIENLKILANR